MLAERKNSQKYFRQINFFSRPPNYAAEIAKYLDVRKIFDVKKFSADELFLQASKLRGRDSQIFIQAKLISTAKITRPNNFLVKF